MTARVLRIRDVALYVGMGRSTIYPLVGLREFPPPIRCGFRTSAWKVEELDAYLASRTTVLTPTAARCERLQGIGANTRGDSCQPSV